MSAMSGSQTSAPTAVSELSGKQRIGGIDADMAAKTHEKIRETAGELLKARPRKRARSSKSWAVTWLGLVVRAIADGPPLAL
ncbi:hypothetical protein HII36_09675 [Nonomuraea sp. NN258]|uniref:hypothetical protein n=1 Tax=Nonomuraea antri TaxID=2730852 RepID=UPI001568BB46|nr:hypothetical protein [Nonomuraea antri]NRQ32105.1 hypothetical protein [Nonomuraea antri]